MKNPKLKFLFLFSVLLIHSTFVFAQVQASKEPRHKKVLENKYFRLLDVWMNPGDTTLFHIHSTPSLFLLLSNTDAGTQLMGEEWTKSRNQLGEASYASYADGRVVHRVGNFDTTVFHVTDMELLAPYQPDSPNPPLSFPVLFENEKAIAYRLSEASLHQNIISERGPILAQLAEGQEVVYYDVLKKKATRILTGKYLYIKPESSFYFTSKANDPINLVLFEIK